MTSHFFFAYLLCGVGVALVISTVDLLSPKKPQMGVAWTIIFGIVWPAFLTVSVLYSLGWRPARRR